jgi:hypothetical protein
MVTNGGHEPIYAVVNENVADPMDAYPEKGVSASRILYCVLSDGTTDGIDVSRLTGLVETVHESGGDDFADKFRLDETLRGDARGQSAGGGNFL